MIMITSDGKENPRALQPTQKRQMHSPILCPSSRFYHGITLKLPVLFLFFFRSLLLDRAVWSMEIGVLLRPLVNQSVGVVDMFCVVKSKLFWSRLIDSPSLGLVTWTAYDWILDQISRKWWDPTNSPLFSLLPCSSRPHMFLCLDPVGSIDEANDSLPSSHGQSDTVVCQRWRVPYASTHSQQAAQHSTCNKKKAWAQLKCHQIGSWDISRGEHVIRKRFQFRYLLFWRGRCNNRHSLAKKQPLQPCIW